MNSLLSCLSFIVILIDSVLSMLLLSSIIDFKNILSEVLGVLLFTATATITVILGSSQCTIYTVLFVVLLVVVFFLSDTSNNYGKKITAAVFLPLVLGGIQIFYAVLIEKQFSVFPSDTTLQLSFLI